MTGRVVEWPVLTLGQRDLAAICAPRVVHPVEYQIQNELYGAAAILKAYAGWDPQEPLPCTMEHAITFDHPSPHPADVESTLPLKLAITEQQAAALARTGNATVVPVGSIHFYLQAVAGSGRPGAKPSERRGTLVFPDKCTHGLVTEFDRSRFARDLAALPAEFQPVVISIYWDDYNRGYHRPFQDLGLAVVSSGHPYDPQFLFRQFELCRQFLYSCSNDLSTSFCFSVLSGCRYFYWPTGPVQMTTGGVTTTYAEDPTLAWPGKRACLEVSAFPPSGSGAAQRAIAERFAGAEHVLAPSDLRALFERGRALLASEPPEALSFEPMLRRDALARWGSRGLDADGWAHDRCRLAWRGETLGGVDVYIEIAPRPDPQWRGTLAIDACGRGSVRFPVRSGYWLIELAEQGPGRPASLALEGPGCEPLPGDGRRRGLRVLAVRPVRRAAGAPLALLPDVTLPGRETDGTAARTEAPSAAR